MKAFVTIQNYGNAAALASLVYTLSNLTDIPVSINQNNCVLLVCEPKKLGKLFVTLAGNDKTNWIEYTVQFDW